MEDYSVRSGLLDQQSDYVIVNNGGRFDLQSALGKMPRFIWSKYSGEKHMIYKFPSKSYSYLGPGTKVDIRLDENDIDHKIELIEDDNQTFIKASRV